MLVITLYKIGTPTTIMKNRLIPVIYNNLLREAQDICSLYVVSYERYILEHSEYLAHS